MWPQMYTSTTSSASRRQNLDSAPADGTNGLVAQGENPFKRRRIIPFEQPIKNVAPKNENEEPEPMHIDPPIEKAVRPLESVHPSRSRKAESSASLTIPIVSVQPSAPVASAQAGVSSTAPNPSSNRYVPIAPPTAQQVADRLLRQLPTKSTMKQATPKPPPPSPFVMSPKQAPSTTQLNTHKLAVNAKRDAAHSAPRRRFLQRIVLLFFLAVSVKVSYGFLKDQTLPSTWPWRETFQSINIMPAFLLPKSQTARIFHHVIPPGHLDGTEPRHQVLTGNFTLRDFILHPEGFHLALAPAFFGIFAYVGVFSAWDDDMPNKTWEAQIKSVAGASAGAMAAVLLAAGIEPHKAAELCSSMTLGKFADPPGIGGLFKGDKFEQIMEEFMRSEKPDSSMQLQDAKIPVAVSVFDLKTFKGRILSRGSMAKAARASATFPILFQPVAFENGILVDGGVTDMLGLRGLAAFDPEQPKRVINLSLGGFPFGPPGPKSMPEGVMASEVLSLSIHNTPRCGPWAMANGPRAIESARRAMLASLDLPLYYGEEQGHYELHLDADSVVERI